MATRVASLFAELDLRDNATQGLRTFGNRLQGLGSKMQNLGDAVSRVGRNAATLGAPVAGAMFFSVRAAINFEAAFANVEKTVDGTEEQLSTLRDTIRRMATDRDNPLSAMENAHVTLSDIAAIGGQMGIAVDDLDEFTQTVGELLVATDLTAESAGFLLGRFQAMAGLETKDFDNFASALVNLGNNLPATESAISEVAQEIVATGKQAGLQADEILILAGAFAALDVQPQRARSALSQFFNTVTPMIADGSAELRTLADLAGQAPEEFQANWTADRFAAFNDFLRGLGELSETEAIEVLEELGLDGIIVGETLARLAGNMDTVDKATRTTTEAWHGYNRATEEARKKADTTAGGLNRLRNQANDTGVAIGDNLTPALNDLSIGLEPVLEKLTEFSEKHPGVVLAIGLMAIGLVALGAIAMVVGPAISVIGAAIGAIGVAAGTTIGTVGLLIIVFAGLLVLVGGLIFGFGDMLTAVENFAGVDLSGLRGIADFLDKIAGKAKDAIHNIGELLGIVGVNTHDPYSDPEIQAYVERQEASGVGSGLPGAQRHGGPVLGGRPYIVGEDGPELFLPGMSGSVVPAGQTAAMRGMGGGGGITITGPVHIHGVQDIKALTSQIEREASKRARRMVR